MKTTASTRRPAGVPKWQTPPPSEALGAQVWFDQAAVDKVVNFFAKHLRHVKTRQWAGAPLALEPWQIEYLIEPVFGWRYIDDHPNGELAGTRVVREAWWEFPRKHGKSTLASGVGLYMVSSDGESGAECYTFAKDRRQAGFVFDPARRMVKTGSQALRDRLQPLKNSIVYEATDSFFQPLPGDDDGKLNGANIHFAAIDEVHIIPNRATVEILETDTGSRAQPLILFITTADEDKDDSIYAEKRLYVEQLAQRLVEPDPSVYGAVFAADDDIDPFSVEALEQANVGIDVTVGRSYLLSQQAKAKATPARLANYKRLHLGIRSKPTEATWLDLVAWDESAGLLVEDKLKGRSCFGGIDLGSTSDFTAWVMVFPAPEPEPWDVLCHFWVPEAAVAKREKLQSTLRAWQREGFLTVTDGDVTDYRKVRAQIEADAKRFVIEEIAYDPWQATETVLELDDAGLTVWELRQTITAMSAPSALLEQLVGDRRLRHGGNPVLRWMASNVVPVIDENERVKPSKKRSQDKIDGITALVDALAAATREDSTDSAVALIVRSS